jgi:hypothetical protein
LGELILDRSLAASFFVNRFLGEFSRLNSSTSRASRVHVRAMSTKTSRTRALGARSANCWQSYERFLHIAGVSTAQSPSVGYPTQNGSESKRRLPIRDKNSRLRNRFGAEEVWWNRLFRLDVVAVKGTADEQGWTKDRITKSNALPIRAARYRWEASGAGRASTNASPSSSTPRKSKLRGRFGREAGRGAVSAISGRGRSKHG